MKVTARWKDDKTAVYTDSSGFYRLSAPEGSVEISVDAAHLSPSGAAPVQAIVRAGQTTRADVMIDSGIR